ncbi:MAG: prephenate dehydrogenase [Bryobacteraceae bacterium]
MKNEGTNQTIDTVAIVGVGLIGGSFARALRERAGFHGRILGVSRPEFAGAAVRAGVIDEAVTLEDAAARSGFLYLSAAIGRIAATVATLDPYLKAGALVTDAGSTKRRIMDAGAAIRRGVFVGGHPMAGKEQRGSAAADPDLFAGRTYFLTFAAEDHKQLPAVLQLRRWLGAFGANVVEIEPAAHDRLVAFTSHLGQLASTGLALTVDRQVAERARTGAGSGIIDMTRLAMSGWDGLWSDILATNHDAIGAALDAYISELQRIRANLQGDFAADFDRAAAFAAKLRKS